MIINEMLIDMNEAQVRTLEQVALNDALAGRHLCAFRVGDVGLEFAPLPVQALGSRFDELAGARGFLTQGIDSGLAFGL